ncbi:MAG TPA: response regulator transcription factor [candidate division Zixibacteria bacterium]|nr:response regulator transcription factor [candidate division Zixibacteria bacterium]
MKRIRVLLADDHTLVRKGLRALLDEAPEIQVIGEASDGRDAVAKTNDKQPDVILMDISMPLLSGLEATRQIMERNPDARIIILTVHSNEEYLLQALRAGAAGYLLKEAAPTDLIRAIKVVHLGEAFLSPSISRNLIKDYVEKTELLTMETRYDRLSNREREVLQLIAEGYPIRDIAAHLLISEKTVRTHRANLVKKLDIHSTAELTLYALRHGLISLE